MTQRSAFASVLLDADSTLCGVEGIDWLAGLRGPDVGAAIARLTERAMNGEIALDAIYGERLRLIQPMRAEVAALADVYCRRLAPGAAEVIARLRAAGVGLRIVSGGIAQALHPVVSALGFADDEVFAVALRFDANGVYVGFDETSPLTSAEGKAIVAAAMALPHPMLAVGDGSTDLAMRSVADQFTAFTGFVRRDAVVAAADHEVRTFDELAGIVLCDRP